MAPVAHETSIDSPTRPSRPTPYRRRRLAALCGAVLVLVLAHATFAGAGRPLPGTARPPRDGRGAQLGPVRWPAQGQAAIVLGNGRPAASPLQQPVAIASLAKVMTAYLTLKRYPLGEGQDGFTITVSDDEAEGTVVDGQGQSVVALRAGEELSERQLLEALLIPSGNNIAQILAADVAGSETRFVAEMNAEARTLGMGHTIYTDPSGFDSGPVSTAADQLRILRRAMRFAVFREIVSMPDVTLPVAGTVDNYNPLINQGYAGKTGSDSAAGGCLAFFTRVTVSGRRLTAAGVVLGQGQGSDTSEILAAAGGAAQQLVDAAVAARRG